MPLTEMLSQLTTLEKKWTKHQEALNLLEKQEMELRITCNSHERDTVSTKVTSEWLAIHSLNISGLIEHIKKSHATIVDEITFIKRKIAILNKEIQVIQDTIAEAANEKGHWLITANLSTLENEEISKTLKSLHEQYTTVFNSGYLHSIPKNNYNGINWHNYSHIGFYAPEGEVVPMMTWLESQGATELKRRQKHGPPSLTLARREESYQKRLEQLGIKAN